MGALEKMKCIFSIAPVKNLEKSHEYFSLIGRDENGSDMDGYHRYHICFHISGRIRIRIRIMSIMSDKIRLDDDITNISIQIRIRYRMLNIRTRIRTDLNLSKRIQSRIQSENIHTVFIPTHRTLDSAKASDASPASGVLSVSGVGGKCVSPSTGERRTQAKHCSRVR